MATNPMQRKSRNSFILGVLITVLIMGIIVAFLVFQISQMKKAEKAREASSRLVYALISDVKSGDIISKDNMKAVTVDGSAAPTDPIDTSYITESTAAKIDLTAGTVLAASMVQDSEEKLTDDLRLQEYNMIKLFSGIQSDSFIDIRLRMPSGLDYIVISKKRVQIPESSAENTMWIKLTEDEILTLDSAIVENYMVEGSMLYTAQYVEAGMQASATPTYIPKQEIVNLITQNPNVAKEAGQAVYNRYTGDSIGTRNAISGELSANSENAMENLKTKVEAEIEAASEARQKYLESLTADSSYTEY